MANKFNKTCECCGKQYKYCQNCAQYKFEPVWKNSYHDENCRNIFNHVSSYYAKLITKEELRTRLESCDLSDKENFIDSIKRAIKEVFPPVKEVKEPEKVEEPEVVKEPEKIKEPEVTAEVATKKKRNYTKKEFEQ